MNLEPLSDEFLDELEAGPVYKHTFSGPIHLTKEEKEWREINYDKSNWVETFPCDFCGCCPSPGQCVRAVQCPLCLRPAGYGCVRPTDSLVVAPYHNERWLLVKERYGTYYR